MRDLRDPEKLGHAYLKARGMGASVEEAVKAPAPATLTEPTCIDKYGSANDVQEKWERIQIK